MKALDKVIAAVSPQKAVKRVEARAQLQRYEAAYESHKRKYHACREEQGKGGKKDVKEKRALRMEASRLLKNNQFAKYAFRDAQAYLCPSGWIPQTGDSETNRKINDMVSLWMETADITGKRHLLDIFSLGCGMQLIEGDMGLGLIKGKNGLGVQPIRSMRIGGPPHTSLHFHKDRREKEKAELEKRGLYMNGVETDHTGKVTYYWIYREETRTGIISDQRWVFDKKFDAENFLLFQDPIDIDEERGVTEFAQAIDNLKDHEESMGAMGQKVKVLSKMFGRWKS